MPFMLGDEQKSIIPRSRSFWIMFVIAMSLIVLSAIGWGFQVLNKVLNGHGLDNYFTFWGVQFNYIGALILCIIGFVVLLLSPVIRWWCLRDERNFKRKYSIND